MKIKKKTFYELLYKSCTFLCKEIQIFLKKKTKDPYLSTTDALDKLVKLIMPESCYIFSEEKSTQINIIICIFNGYRFEFGRSTKLKQG